jgi:uncharacterized cysteine cluster protein YcgN (CxxCxxCC family)
MIKYTGFSQGNKEQISKINPSINAAVIMSRKKQPFYSRLSLDEMSQDQWESLCDRCGLCCLQKFENQKTGAIRYSGIACEFLDTHTCQCMVYDDRHFINKECIALDRDIEKHLKWLPETCAYRRLSEGKKLPRWHPLVSGDSSSVHKTHISARDKAVSGLYIHPEDIDIYF